MRSLQWSLVCRSSLLYLVQRAHSCADITVSLGGISPRPAILPAFLHTAQVPQLACVLDTHLFNRPRRTFLRPDWMLEIPTIWLPCVAGVVCSISQPRDCNWKGPFCAALAVALSGTWLASWKIRCTSSSSTGVVISLAVQLPTVPKLCLGKKKKSSFHPVPSGTSSKSLSV